MALSDKFCWPWPGTTTLPAHHTRVTELDGVYIQFAATGADADLTTARGNASHNHTSPSHAPTQNSHTHTNVLTPDAPDSTILGASGTSTVSSSDIHAHPTGVTSTAQTATNNGVAITVNSTNNELFYKEVIFIKSDGTATGCPSGAYGFFLSDTLPTGWPRVLGNTYLKGAAAASNGGGTGGANTHNHTSPAHTHTQNSHSHQATSSSADSGVRKTTGTVTSGLVGVHTHALDLNGVVATNQSVTTTISTDNHEPVHKKINIIRNDNAGEDLPNDICALYLGTVAQLASETDWARVTGYDGYFPKGANADGESNVTTGGSATHTHTASDCQPTQNSHTHAITDNGTSATAIKTGDGLQGYAFNTHHHTGWTLDATTATNNAATVSIDTSASEAAYPPYRRVIFVQYTAPAAANPRVFATIIG